ncbi:N-acetylglucosaminyl transferase component-domain-containing protein [Phycomyces blakesleeanus]
MLRERNRANTAETRAYYISFYNSMWLVANDIIIGLAIGSFLMSNSYSAAKVLHGALNKYTVESLQSMMLWFLESPAGLKLNHELGSFLSELFLWLIHFLAFMTLHVYCFHMVAARIFNWQLLILHSLFNLFRGKKRNTLRNRIDSCDYALDQLLLGTCLFTLLTFLFPTVLIYYLTFAVKKERKKKTTLIINVCLSFAFFSFFLKGRVGVIFLQAVMETLLAFFNHFPLFAIMLRAKDPDRLPGGLQFDIFDHNNFLKKHHPLYYRLKNLKIGCQKLWSTISVGSSSSSSSAAAAVSRAKAKKSQIQLDKTDSRRGTYLRMRNMPIPFGAIFFQYMLLWKRLSVHYFSVYVFKCLLCGEPIKPIPKLQVRPTFFLLIFFSL